MKNSQTDTRNNKLMPASAMVDDLVNEIRERAKKHKKLMDQLKN